MKRKRVFPTELAYAAGLLLLAFGTALMERADFGLSTIVAPAYLLHLRIGQTHPAFTFGAAEYCTQAALLVLLAAVTRRFRLSYLFSFITALIYGFVLDLMMELAGRIPAGGLPGRAVFYVCGLVVCAAGVALLFRTYLSPEAYELFVKEISSVYGFEISRVKTVYDCCSCAVAVVLSFAFFGFGHFEGIKAGTVLCALVNGTLIGAISRFFDRVFAFRDALGLRRFFEKL